MQHMLADRLVYRKLKDRTGGRIRFFISGGAALVREFGEFFEAIGLQIIEGYGLSESSPVIAVNRMDDYKFGTVGKPIPGIEVRIAPDGEILARGSNIMKGYWNDPAATKEAIDKSGWLHTGDIGMFDEEGFLHITDRKKHLFKSSGGKFIAPQQIENLLLESKYVDQIIVIGEGRPNLVALVIPDFELVEEFARHSNIKYADRDELAGAPDIRKLFEEEFTKLQKDLPAYERVRKFTLLSAALTVEAGEVTPTMKVKRKVVEEKYRGLIDKMYEAT
jgi:long-chain acyl-CoA synthetase